MSKKYTFIKDKIPQIRTTLKSSHNLLSINKIQTSILRIKNVPENSDEFSGTFI